MPRVIDRGKMTEKIHVTATAELRHMAERAAARADDCPTFSDWVRRAIRLQAKQELGEAA